MIKSFGIDNKYTNCWLNALAQMLISCPSFNSILQPLDLYSREFYIMTEGISGVYSFSEAFFAHLLKIDPMYAQKSVEEAFDYLMDKFEPMIQSLFHIRYKNVIMCQCGYTSATYDNMNIMRLPNGADLGTYLVSHESDIDYKCTCGRKITTRREQLVSISDIIVVVSNFANSELETVININKNGSVVRYRCVATVEYSTGHYYATGARSDGLFMFDDGNVARIDIIGNTPRTYMMVYNVIKN